VGKFVAGCYGISDMFWAKAAIKRAEMQNRIGRGVYIMPLGFVVLFFVCNGLI
jgi:hypothetical protein